MRDAEIGAALGSYAGASSSSAVSSSSSAIAAAGRKPGALHLTDRDSRQDPEPRVDLFSASIAPLDDNLLYVMDIEVHSMQQDNKFVSQITCVPLTGKGHSYNAYVFLHPLQRPWMDLVEAGQVELAKWDDKAVARPFPVVWRDLCVWLPRNAILLFKGRADKAVIERSLGARGQEGLDAGSAGNALNIRLQSIDALWWHMCAKTNLPDFAKTLLFGKRTAAGAGKFPVARPLGVIYKALFWNPLLICVQDRGEELVDTGGEVRITSTDLALDQDDEPMPMEFLMQKHLQPVWHTSHTDTLATCHITSFLLWWMKRRRKLTQRLLAANDVEGEILGFTANSNVSSEQVAFYMLSTHVARLTNLFRSKNLALPERAYDWVYGLYTDVYKPVALDVQLVERPPDPLPASSSSSSVAEVKDPDSEVDDDDATIGYPLDDDDDEDDIDIYRVLDNERLHSTDRARKKLMEQAKAEASGVAVFHKGGWVMVHKPRNRDATRLRAAKVMLGIQDVAPGGKTRYDVLEEQRRVLAPLAPRIDDRPWYYYPTATGSQGPFVQVLHTRRCLDRKNGNSNNRAKAAPASSDKIAVYQFDQIKRVVGYRLRFCKECKQYDSNEVDELVDALGALVVDDAQPVYVNVLDPYLPALQTIFDKLSTTAPVQAAYGGKPLQMKQSDRARIVFASVTTAMSPRCHELIPKRARILVICSPHHIGLKTICTRIRSHTTAYSQVVGIQWNKERTRYAVDSMLYPLNRDAIVAIGEMVLR